MSDTALVSFGTRLEPVEANETNDPSKFRAGRELPPFDSSPVLLMLTSSVSPDSHSWIKISAVPFVSPSTRFVAVDANATTRPSPLIAGLMQ